MGRILPSLGTVRTCNGSLDPWSGTARLPVRPTQKAPCSTSCSSCPPPVFLVPGSGERAVQSGAPLRPSRSVLCGVVLVIIQSIVEGTLFQSSLTRTPQNLGAGNVVNLPLVCGQG